VLDGGFDGVLCIDVLEHIERDDEFLSEVASVMGPKGRILIHVPARDQRHPLPGVWRKYLRQMDQGTDQHVREGYEHGELIDLLSRAGLSVRCLQPTFGWCATLWTDLDATLAEGGAATVPLRIGLLPLTIFGAWLSPHLRRASGNGWLVCAEKSRILVFNRLHSLTSSPPETKDGRVTE